MTALQALLHLGNALLPALALALLMPLIGRWALPPTARNALQTVGLCATIFAVCSAITLLALALTGQDGKMLGYAAQGLAAGTLVWAWRWLGPRIR